MTRPSHLGPSGLQPVTAAGQQNDIWSEIKKLWAAIGSRGRDNLYDIPFTYPGALITTTSPPWVAPNAGGALKKAVIHLGAPSTSGSVSIEIRKNGTVIPAGTITMAAGATKAIKYFNEVFNGDADLLTIRIASVGTGTQNLTAQLRFRMF